MFFLALFYFLQYWYSPNTIDCLVAELVSLGGKIALLSAPSIYFALPEQLRSSAYIFDFDKKWADERYDQKKWMIIFDVKIVDFNISAFMTS